VEQQGSALVVLQRELGQADGGQSRLLADEPDELIEQASADIAGWEAAGMTLLTVLDPDYPANLRTVHDRPPLLFVSGRLEQQDAHSLAVIGSRNPSTRGIEHTEAIAGHLADSGYTVASGLAAGIDATAHTTALVKSARTVAVLGTGLRHSYPPENAALQRTIANTGAVLSQFWPDAGPTRRSFPMRNAVMSGFSLGTVVVEASHRSGARVQARLALCHGRPVFLAHDLMSQQWVKELAKRPGTHVFREPREISGTVERLSSPGALLA
jgi:DNA processing protein